jgi:hypothetical protein
MHRRSEDETGCIVQYEAALKSRHKAASATWC